MNTLQRLAREIEKRHPCTDKFNPEKLADGLHRLGDVKTILYKDKRYGWIGNRGSLWNAPLGLMRSYVRCADVHGEDAAKIWAWLQGWIVGVDTPYYDEFKEEIDGADGDIPGSEVTANVPARDWKRESSGEGLDDLEDGLPF